MKEKLQKITSLISFSKWALVSSVLVFILVFNYLFSIELRITPNYQSKKTQNDPANLATKPDQVVVQSIPQEVKLPIKWSDLGKKLVDTGVIDSTKFSEVMGTLSENDKKLLDGNSNGEIVMNQANARLILNMLWAFGLANKNDVLNKGEMMQEPSQTGNMASTGGWSLSKGKAMDHYSAHNFVTLTTDQQKMVEEMSKNIYRPCCNNSTHFPDCNHGMAMLGLLELMAVNNVSVQEAYKVALDVNALWFPQQYQEMAVYFKENGRDWNQIDAKTALGMNYSSASGYRQMRSQIKSLPQAPKGGGGCGV
ncbi:MAG TPA: hypothetical protein VJL30_02550 [Patescibacteria group bacterium]|uniref:Uncharacterized protein n=1 Tax=candidate division WWE3 bacterium RIFCSPHIGHO2_02_FULL_38_14 TaxID=1802620 RepID=A0A1F4V7Q8_UNCKA|nr:MAG: hypothetical protein A2793_00205 [candidate division WWE3 bacterium RIFCSPHIGHO2_01_FULL_38_45]OGC53275.1 MAG: hypothetical protein A3D91_02570 [candidate division WWE3 bacterium RIFCSPHIGHO2_02_FULL_38_14]HLB51779.1 hypothetical protein [Patescibacteria group bacterium]